MVLLRFLQMSVAVNRYRQALDMQASWPSCCNF